MRVFRYICICAILSTFLFSGVLYAEESFERAVEDNKKIGLMEAWQMALGNHEAVAVAKESSVQSSLDISRAYSQVLPSLKADGSYTRYTEERSSSAGFSLQPEDSYRVELRLYQPIYSGGRAKSTLRQAKKMHFSAELGVDGAREEVLIMTARAYYGLLQAGKAVSIVTASLERLEEQLRVASTRLKIGLGTRADLLRAESELAERAADLVEAKGYRRDAENLFRRVTGIEAVDDINLPVDIDPADEVAFFERLTLKIDLVIKDALALAFKSRDDYRQSVLAEGVAEDGIKYARGAYLPTVSIEGVHVMRGQTPETSFFLDEATYGVLNVSVPIFEGGLRRADLSKARSRKRQAELTRTTLRRDIELELRGIYNDMATTKSRVGAYSKQFEFAKLNYETVFKQYEHGLADSVELIDGETLLASAELKLANAGFAYKLSIIEVAGSLGTLLDELLEEGHELIIFTGRESI